MIMDGGWFMGFLLDLDYAFSWKEALHLAGFPITDEDAWVKYVEEHDKKVARYTRFGPKSRRAKIATLLGKDMDQPGSTTAHASWKERMHMKERTVRSLFSV